MLSERESEKGTWKHCVIEVCFSDPKKKTTHI